MYQVYRGDDDGYLVIDLETLRLENMPEGKALKLWSAHDGKPGYFYNARGEGIYWWKESPVDYPLFSAGRYGNKYIVLLKEYNKCVVVRWNQDGLFVGSTCIQSGVVVRPEKSSMEYIYKDRNCYTLRIYLQYSLDGYIFAMLLDIDVLHGLGGAVGKLSYNDVHGVGFQLLSPRGAFLS